MALTPMGSIPALHAARDPRRPAVTVGEETLSWVELEARANVRARMLMHRGVTEGDFVMLALPNGLEFYETAFATWKLGATVAPVSAKLPDLELQAISELLQPKVLIGVEPTRLRGIAALPAGLPLNEELSAAPLPPIVAKYWKAMTSGGSTGTPKVIVIHQPSAFDPEKPFRLMTADDTILNPGPLYHNGPFTVTFSGMFGGGHAVDMVRFDPERALQLIERHRVNWVNFVPTMMHRIWRLPEETRGRYDLSSLRIVFHMASACPRWLKSAWIEWLGSERIYELYGGTENIGGTVISGAEWLGHRGSVGRIQPGASLKILTEDGVECKTGEIGEIFLRPDGGADTRYHYIGAVPKARGEWHTLGDMGWLDEEGYLYLADRRSDLIISGGANIYPAEVEAALDAHPLVKSSAVIGIPDDDLGQSVHAIVQRDDNEQRVSAEDLLAFLSKRLVSYKLPRSIEFVSTPLRDDAGKVRRSALREERLSRP